MTRCSPESIISPSTDALDALMWIQRSGNGWLLVAANGELCGILSLERHAARPLAQAEAWRRVPAKWFGTQASRLI
jgi:hypothetical protein